MTSADQILSETIDVPGYGEAISDPTRLPPYTEDLGGGNAHTVTLNGTEYWTLDGSFHRGDDKPAYVTKTGYKVWYRNGKRHRDGDKPAIVYSDGTEEYWTDGERVPKP